MIIIKVNQMMLKKLFHIYDKIFINQIKKKKIFKYKIYERYSIFIFIKWKQNNIDIIKVKI
jgi:hypothetical protein